MSILGFHRVLIGTAILFCLLFGAWEAIAFARGGGALDLALAIAFAAAAAALAYYLANLERFLGRRSSR